MPGTILNIMADRAKVFDVTLFMAEPAFAQDVEERIPEFGLG
jgi:hypothetical protein